MLSDFLMDVLLMHQGRGVCETAILMHWLKISEPMEIHDWRAFLFQHVEPGDYIFSHDARDIMVEGLARRLRMINTLNPALEKDEYNHEMARRYGTMFLKTRGRMVHSIKDQDQFLRRWYPSLCLYCLFYVRFAPEHSRRRRINTGLYIGPRRAWELYIERLATCLTEASDARAYVKADDVSEVGERLGLMLRDVFSINSFMLAPVPIY